MRPPCDAGGLFCEHAIDRITARAGDEDRQGAAHDRDVLQKIIVLPDLLRAGGIFPITMGDRGSEHHEHKSQNCAVTHAEAQYEAGRDQHFDQQRRPGKQRGRRKFQRREIGQRSGKIGNRAVCDPDEDPCQQNAGEQN